MRKILMGMMILGIALTGCKKEEGGGPSVNLSGYWIGEWVSTQSQDSGPITVKLSQDLNGEISGWFYLLWSDSVPVTGQVSGYNIELGYVVGNDSTTCVGEASTDGNHANGTYTVRDSGIVDQGTWYVDRVEPNWGGTWNGTIVIPDIPPDTIDVSDGKWDAAFVEYTKNDTTFLGGFMWIYYNSDQDTIANARPAGGLIKPQDSIYFSNQVNVNSNKGYMGFTGELSGLNYSGTWFITPYPDMVTGNGNWEGGKK